MSLFTNLAPSLARSPARSEPASPAEPTIKPVYEIKETDDAYGLTVYLPGVAKDAVEITTDEGELRVFGRRTWRQPEGWTSLYRETAEAPFELVLAHDNLIDAGKVVAELKDGVLRVSLPKHEAAKPRKIAVS